MDTLVPDAALVEQGKKHFQSLNCASCHALPVLPDQRIALGTRHGEIYFIDGIDEAKPNPRFHHFATGLDEIFGLTWHDGALRSPGGIGFDEHGALFYIESQGPWNCSCSLKAVSPRSCHGHPASFEWYRYSPELGPEPPKPNSGTRIVTEKERVPQLVPYSVIFPYIRMGRSITAFTVNQTGGKFGPFENPLFLGDYTQSILMRATTEEVNGVWRQAVLFGPSRGIRACSDDG